MKKHLIKDVSRTRLHVAACALAVHPIQWEKENLSERTFESDNEFEEFISKMHCGVKFLENEKKDVSGGGVKSATQQIASQFGISEPTEKSALMRRNDVLFDLFVMQPSQQMVELAMLELNLPDV